MCPAINQQYVLFGTVSFDGWRKQEETLPCYKPPTRFIT